MVKKLFESNIKNEVSPLILGVRCTFFLNIFSQDAKLK